MNRSAIDDQNNDNIVDEPKDILEEYFGFLWKKSKYWLFHIKSQIFDFKSKYSPFYAVYLVSVSV